MALRPCSFGLHRYRGPAATFYAALSTGVDMTRWKVWTCPEHAAVVDKALAPYEIGDGTLAEDSTANLNACLTCGGTTSRDDSRLFYVTAYLQGQDRRDFSGFIHDTCGSPGFLPNS